MQDREREERGRNRRVARTPAWLVFTRRTPAPSPNPIPTAETAPVLPSEIKPEFPLLLELWALGERDPEIGRELGRLYAEQRAAFADALRRAEAETRTRLRGDPEATAETLLAVADGFAVQSRVEPDRPLEARLGVALLAARYLLGES
jgi:hypothetical protein